MRTDAGTILKHVKNSIDKYYPNREVTYIVDFSDEYYLVEAGLPEDDENGSLFLVDKKREESGGFNPVANLADFSKALKREPIYKKSINK